MDRQNSGLCGPGADGQPMAANLLRAAGTLRSGTGPPVPLQDLENLGGRRAPDVAGMRDLPVIVFMLPDLSFIEEAAAGLLAELARSAAAGRHRRGGHEQLFRPPGVQDFGRRVQRGQPRQRRGGGRSGQRRNRPAAADGTLAIMAGGAAEDFRRLEPFFGGDGNHRPAHGPIGRRVPGQGLQPAHRGNHDGGTRRSGRTRRALGHGSGGALRGPGRRPGRQPRPGDRGTTAGPQGLHAHRPGQVHAQGPFLCARLSPGGRRGRAHGGCRRRTLRRTQAPGPGRPGPGGGPAGNFTTQRCTQRTALRKGQFQHERTF